ncbi:MAG: L,D-transpeptidase family protein [Thermoguttaceae bacterium]
MNSLKNLLILIVLGAIGYGLYNSLAKSNIESSSSSETAPPWSATSTNLDVSNGATASPNSLALKAPGVPPAVQPTTAIPPSTSPLQPASPAAPYASSVPPTMASTSTASTPASAAFDAPSAAPPSVVRPSVPNPAPTMPDRPTALPATSNPTSSLAAANTESSSNSLSSVVRNLAPPPGATAAANTVDTLVQSKFTAFMDAVKKKLDEGKLAEAHLALSTLYGNPDLPPDQAKQITDLLDQLAGTVIYSRKHYLEPPYRTQPGDTLDRIAQQYNVPWELLGHINGLLPPGNVDPGVKDRPLPQGTELKVVRGPFEAVVRLDRRELALMVQNRYAGRFRIGVGRDQPKLEGEYTVRDKVANPTYYGPDGVTIPSSDPKNPLGAAWIGLTDRIGILGTGDPQAIGRDDNRGTICVGERDLQDLYGILSVGSRVTVLR